MRNSVPEIRSDFLKKYYYLNLFSVSNFTWMFRINDTVTLSSNSFRGVYKFKIFTICDHKRHNQRSEAAFNPEACIAETRISWPAGWWGCCTASRWLQRPDSSSSSPAAAERPGWWAPEWPQRDSGTSWWLSATPPFEWCCTWTHKTGHFFFLNGEPLEAQVGPEAAYLSCMPLLHEHTSLRRSRLLRETALMQWKSCRTTWPTISGSRPWSCMVPWNCPSWRIRPSRVWVLGPPASMSMLDERFLYPIGLTPARLGMLSLSNMADTWWKRQNVSSGLTSLTSIN